MVTGSKIPFSLQVLGFLGQISALFCPLMQLWGVNRRVSTICSEWHHCDPCMLGRQTKNKTDQNPIAPGNRETYNWQSTCFPHPINTHLKATRTQEYFQYCSSIVCNHIVLHCSKDFQSDLLRACHFCWLTRYWSFRPIQSRNYFSAKIALFKEKRSHLRVISTRGKYGCVERVVLYIGQWPAVCMRCCICVLTECGLTQKVVVCQCTELAARWCVVRKWNIVQIAVNETSDRIQ